MLKQIIRQDLRYLLLVVCIATIATISGLGRFFRGEEILSLDMTFYWDVVRRHFFSTWNLWWDQCGNGYALSQNPLYALYSILNWPYLVFSPGNAIRAEVLTFFIGMPILTFAWLRSLSIKPFASASASLLCSTSVMFLEMVWRNKPYLYPVLFIPLAGFAGVLFARSTSRRNFIFGNLLGSLAASSAFFAGDVLGPLYCLLAFICSYTHAVCSQSAIRFSLLNWRLLRGGVVGCILQSLFALLIVAFQIDDTLAVLKVSEREGALPASEALFNSFHPIRFLEFAYSFLGDHRDATFSGLKYTSHISGGPSFWFPTITFGVFPCIVFLLGLVAAIKKRDGNLPFVAVIFGLAFFATGRWNPAVVFLFEHLSWLRFLRFPEKLMLPAVVLALPIVGAGTEFTMTRMERIFRDRVSPSVIKVLMFFLLLGQQSLMQPRVSYAPINYIEPPEIITALQTLKPNGRYNFGTVKEISKISQHHLIMLGYNAIYWGVHNWTCPEATSSLEHYYLGNEYFSLERERIGVNYLISSRQLYEQRRDINLVDRLKLAYQSTVDDLVILSDLEEVKLFGVFSDWNLWQPIITPGFHSLRNGMLWIYPKYFLDFQGRIRNFASTEAGAQKMEFLPDRSCTTTPKLITGSLGSSGDSGSFEVESDCKALLVVNKRFTDGWSAKINGKPVPIFQVNSFMMGIPVEPGHSSILLKYKSRWGEFGPIIALLSQFVMIVLAIACFRNYFRKFTSEIMQN